MSRSRPVTDFEQQVLGVLLVELRRAMRLRAQLSIIIDPYLQGGGAVIFAGPNEQGTTYTIDAAEVAAAAGHRPTAAIGKRYREGGSSTLPSGACPACGNEVALRKGGLVREHRARPNDARPCRGSGKKARS